MIITGRWVYKKYKKRRAEKEELSKIAQSKHGELLQKIETERSDTVVELPGSTVDEAQRSDLPPRYSGVDQDPFASPTSTRYSSSTVGSATGSSRQRPLDFDRQEASLSFPSRTQLSSPMQTGLSGLPTPTGPLLPQLTAGQATEIQVRGKWVWVSEDSPLPSVLASQPTQSMVMNSGSAVELPAASPPKELPSFLKSEGDSERDQNRGFVAELDSKKLPVGDSDEEMYVARRPTQ